MDSPQPRSFKPATPLGVLGKLPTELRLEIFGHLDYSSSILLAATNRYYRDLIDPSALPEIDKVNSIKRVEWYGQHCGDDIGFACFQCYRVRKRKHFNSNEVEGWFRKSPLSGINPKFQLRVCLDCGDRLVILSHGSRAPVVERDFSRLRWVCDICDNYPNTLSNWGCTHCDHCVRGLWDTHEFLKPACPKCENGLLRGYGSIAKCIALSMKMPVSDDDE